MASDRSAQRSAGIVSENSSSEGQPLLSDIYYLDRSLSPYAEIAKGNISQLLNKHVSVLILADVAKISGDDLGKATLSSGSASLSIASLTPGSHAISATYSGDNNFVSSTTNISAITINQSIIVLDASAGVEGSALERAQPFEVVHTQTQKPDRPGPNRSATTKPRMVGPASRAR